MYKMTESSRNKLQEYLISLRRVKDIKTLSLEEIFLLGYSLAKYEGSRKLTDIALFMIAVHRGEQQGFLAVKQKEMLHYLIFEGAFDAVPALLQTFSRAEAQKKKEEEVFFENSEESVGEASINAEFQNKRTSSSLPNTQEIINKLESKIRRPQPSSHKSDEIISIPKIQFQFSQEGMRSLSHSKDPFLDLEPSDSKDPHSTISMSTVRKPDSRVLSEKKESSPANKPEIYTIMNSILYYVI